MKIAYNAYCFFFAFAFDYCVFLIVVFLFSMLPFLVNNNVYIYKVFIKIRSVFFQK